MSDADSETLKQVSGSGVFNPYCPPEAPTDGLSLSPDTEFLFNEHVVAGVNRISLPRLCVVTGTHDDLERMHSRLSWSHPSLRMIRNLSLLIAVFWAIPFLMHSFSRPGMGFNLWMDSLLNLARLAAVTVILVAVGTTAAALVFRRFIEVHWCVERRLRKQRRRVQLTVFFLTLAGLLLSLILSWFSVVSGRLFEMLVVPAILINSFTAVNAARRTHLFVAQYENGLFLIGGLSAPFLREVRRLAAAHTSSS